MKRVIRAYAQPFFLFTPRINLDLLFSFVHIIICPFHLYLLSESNYS
jgi:hypothetical protein